MKRKTNKNQETCNFQAYRRDVLALGRQSPQTFFLQKRMIDKVKHTLKDTFILIMSTLRKNKGEKLKEDDLSN